MPTCKCWYFELKAGIWSRHLFKHGDDNIIDLGCVSVVSEISQIEMKIYLGMQFHNILTGYGLEKLGYYQENALRFSQAMSKYSLVS